MGDHADDLMFREIGTRPPDGKIYKCGYCGEKLGSNKSVAKGHVKKCGDLYMEVK